MFSRTMTEASTRIPKSIAPIEIRLAEPPLSTMMEKAKRSEHGMVSAAMSEIGISPRKIMRITVTSVRPMITTWRTVLVVM